ncbi:MAG: hypothetical protein GY820_41935 [Gammaproteobacteria bacterium]|nr:hypothetical protein [Gammaproteobacteria bacterium]
MSVKFLASLLTLYLYSHSLVAAPIITVKCDKPKGKYSSYGKQTGSQDQEVLKPGEVSWEDRSYQGATPMFVMSDDFEGHVIIEHEMSPKSLKKSGLNKKQADELMKNNPRLGQIVAYNGEKGLWVQIYEKSKQGVGIYTLDSATKSMVYNNANVNVSLSDERSVSSWTYFSQCVWYEVRG